MQIFFKKMYSKSNINIKNRRATFDYELLERLCAGIQLFGTEIKSIREGKAGLNDTYCTFKNGELWVINMTLIPLFAIALKTLAEKPATPTIPGPCILTSAILLMELIPRMG